MTSVVTVVASRRQDDDALRRCPDILSLEGRAPSRPTATRQVMHTYLETDTAVPLTVATYSEHPGAYRTAKDAPRTPSRCARQLRTRARRTGPNRRGARAARVRSSRSYRDSRQAEASGEPKITSGRPQVRSPRRRTARSSRTTHLREAGAALRSSYHTRPLSAPARGFDGSHATLRLTLRPTRISQVALSRAWPCACTFSAVRVLDGTLKAVGSPGAPHVWRPRAWFPHVRVCASLSVRERAPATVAR